MPWIQNHGLSIFQFANLSKIAGLYHGAMTRYDRSYGIEQSFNLGLNCGDPSEVVWANRHRMLAAFDAERAIYAHQVHGSQVAVWPDQQSAKTVDGQHGLVNGDAIITSSIQTPLVIMVADCQSVMMADPVKKVIANVHSGWRGSVRNIVAKVVDMMIEQHGSMTKDIVCGIGPSLGPCCAEFVNYKKELPQQYWGYQRIESHFDFWQITMDQLIEKRIPAENIELSHLCTKCNRHLFFSYRGNKQTGRFATLIGWKS